MPCPAILSSLHSVIHIISHPGFHICHSSSRLSSIPSIIHASILSSMLSYIRLFVHSWSLFFAQAFLHPLTCSSISSVIHDLFHLIHPCFLYTRIHSSTCSSIPSVTQDFFHPLTRSSIPFVIHLLTRSSMSSVIRAFFIQSLVHTYYMSSRLTVIYPFVHHPCFISSACSFFCPDLM